MHIDIACRLMSDEIAHQQASLFQLNLSALLVVMLASKKGLGIVDTVSKALSNATFDKQSTQQVLIQSDDSSVLSQFKNVSTVPFVIAGSPCFDLNAKEAILPVQPGSLIGIIQGAEPPAEAPAPVLEVSDIVDPPLPPVVANVSSNSPPAPAPDAKHSSALKEVANLGLSLAVTVALGLLF